MPSGISFLTSNLELHFCKIQDRRTCNFSPTVFLNSAVFHNLVVKYIDLFETKKRAWIFLTVRKRKMNAIEQSKWHVEISKYSVVSKLLHLIV